jgi:hypothetical protein
MLVLPEDAAESITPADIKAGDTGLDGARVRERSERGCLSESSVWSMLVVEGLEFSQRVRQVTRVPDQGVVEEFASADLDPPLRDRVRPWGADTGLDRLYSGVGQYGVGRR